MLCLATLSSDTASYLGILILLRTRGPECCSSNSISCLREGVRAYEPSPCVPFYPSTLNASRPVPGHSQLRYRIRSGPPGFASGPVPVCGSECCSSNSNAPDTSQKGLIGIQSHHSREKCRKKLVKNRQRPVPLRILVRH